MISEDLYDFVFLQKEGCADEEFFALIWTVLLNILYNNIYHNCLMNVLLEPDK